MEHNISRDRFTQSIREIQTFNKNLEDLETILGTELIESPIFNNVALITDSLVNAMSNYNEATIDLINWWLYEDVDKIIYEDDKEISVKTIDELYNYMVECEYI